MSEEQGSTVPAAIGIFLICSVGVGVGLDFCFGIRSVWIVLTVLAANVVFAIFVMPWRRIMSAISANGEKRKWTEETLNKQVSAHLMLLLFACVIGPIFIYFSYNAELITVSARSSVTLREDPNLFYVILTTLGLVCLSLLCFSLINLRKLVFVEKPRLEAAKKSGEHREDGSGEPGN